MTISQVAKQAYPLLTLPVPGPMNRWRDGGMEGWIDGSMDRWIDRQILSSLPGLFLLARDFARGVQVGAAKTY